ncbi:MAG TPA: histidine kinase dimerization/phospho-acceptor domain-containing protein, partial [Verrucomicrobiae bacterium]|nr:histidine kinase dimerization/phospho-acceptor domain-containing protein [Verrucomicrobiae bacterium]
MFKKWRLTDRTRTLLTLELAIVLPAAALMGFSIWNLKHLQHSGGFEAAIQRELSHVLKIAEKKTLHRAIELTTPVRTAFPNPDEDHAAIKAKLDHLLSAHPEFGYALLYDKKNNLLLSRMQPAREQDQQFCAIAQQDINAAASWIPIEAAQMTSHLRAMLDKEEEPVNFYGGWALRDNQPVYWSIAYFVPPGVPKDRTVLGVVSFDPDYVRNTFLPAMMKDVLSSKNTVPEIEANPPVMMIHYMKDSTPWVTSGIWDGASPEAERTFQSVFPELTLAIKYQGLTVADIGARFLRYNYIVLAALSLFMVAGIFLTYRNVSKEMNLARQKSDFVANVSHELRTPLALIRLYAETLELGRLSAKEKYQEYFRIIREESERLTALINNILDFSRI